MARRRSVTRTEVRRSDQVRGEDLRERTSGQKTQGSGAKECALDGRDESLSPCTAQRHRQDVTETGCHSVKLTDAACIVRAPGAIGVECEKCHQRFR